MKQELVKAPQQFREALINSVARQVGTGDVAVMFGGGTDAACIVFSLMELGIKPHLYTFHLEGYESEDLKSSKKFADYFKLKHTTFTIMRDPDALIEDVFVLMNKHRCFPSPTIIQCSQPFLRLFPLVKEPVTMLGFGIDLCYGMSRYMSVNCRNNPDEYHKILIRNYDTGCLFRNGSEHIIYHISKDYGTKLVYPYYDPDILKIFLQLTLKEVSLPKLKQKWISVYAFKDYFDKYPMYRVHSNYQSNAGIQQWHNAVFLNSKYNVKNYRDIYFVYRHMSNNIIIEYD